MIDLNTEQTIDRLLHLLDADQDFSARLRKDFGMAVQTAGVPVSLDAMRNFLSGSSIYPAGDLIESPEYDLGTTPTTSFDFACILFQA